MHLSSTFRSNSNTMKALFLCLSLVLTCAFSLAQFPDALATELQQILDNRVQFEGDNGCAASVILPNGDTWSGQAGVDGEGNPIVEETVFHAASCSKTHVTVCLMLMAQEGLVNLDAPWTDYVSFDVDFDPNITIRQLVNNRSGIADYLEIGGVGATITADMSHFWTPTELLEDVIGQSPDFPADSDFHYSSSNFVLAGQIIEAVSGVGLYEELNNRIWDPLGMNHTYGGAYDDYTEPRAGVWWNFGQGVQNYSDEDETSMLSFAYGGAGAISTPTDQAIFIHALLGGNLVADTSLAQMHEFSPESYDDWSAGYGMGIHHAINVGSDQVIGVDGYFTNMSSTFHNENDGFSVATMTNTQTTWYGIFTPIHAAVRDYLETSVAEQTESNFQVYPIPAHDFVIVDGPKNMPATLEILDARGRIVASQKAQGGPTQFELSHLHPGIYLVRIFDETGLPRSSRTIEKI